MIAATIMSVEERARTIIAGVNASGGATDARAATADLVGVGSSGYGPPRAALVGSASNALVRSARCPVPRSDEVAPSRPRRQSEMRSP